MIATHQTPVAPVLTDLDAAVDRPLTIHARIRSLESAQAQCRHDIAALEPRLALSGRTARMEARREWVGIVRAYAALDRELRSLGVGR